MAAACCVATSGSFPRPTRRDAESTACARRVRICESKRQAQTIDGHARFGTTRGRCIKEKTTADELRWMIGELQTEPVALMEQDGTLRLVNRLNLTQHRRREPATLPPSSRKEMCVWRL